MSADLTEDLAGIPVDLLLTAMHSLTHRIHTAREYEGEGERESVVTLIEQRTLAEDELKRRLDEARTLLGQAAHLLQDCRTKTNDRGLAMQWGRDRKAVVNRAIELEVW